VLSARPSASEGEGLDDVLGVAQPLDAADLPADAGNRCCGGDSGSVIVGPGAWDAETGQDVGATAVDVEPTAGWDDCVSGSGEQFGFTGTRRNLKADLPTPCCECSGEAVDGVEGV
jgi:hypothetical protein